MLNKKLAVLDIEIYPNYSLFAFKNLESEKVLTFELKGKEEKLSIKDITLIKKVLTSFTTFGYNSVNYDMPILQYALQGVECEKLYNLSKHIIENNLLGWQTIKEFDIKTLKDIVHFDVQASAIGTRVSLKLYGGRLNSKYLQELPYSPLETVNKKEIEELKKYCINDLNTTIDLYNKVKGNVKLRFYMSDTYGQKVLSKNDPAISEFVIVSELEKTEKIKLGYKKFVPAPEDYHFYYKPPSYIKFKNPETKELLQKLLTIRFSLDETGKLAKNKEFDKLSVVVGGKKYSIGKGGIHSTEKKQVIIPNKNQILKDKDVTSYYPSLILNLGLYPERLGVGFLRVFRNLVEERIKAKRDGDTLKSAYLKVVIVSCYGKMLSPYSNLYAPNLAMTITITGQLALLMLIESFSEAGLEVVSANTDGITTLLDKSDYRTLENLCFDWELETGLNLEETDYLSLYSRDVNNYLAIKKDGYKGVGLFKLFQLSKNTRTPICVLAVIEYLQKGKPIEKTIKECDDITKFLHITTVSGGGVYKDKYLGKVVRWIYSTKGDKILYKKNGNLVPESTGCRPMMSLDFKNLPDDIDYLAYVKKSQNILESIGIKYE